MTDGSPTSFRHEATSRVCWLARRDGRWRWLYWADDAWKVCEQHVEPRSRR